MVFYVDPAPIQAVYTHVLGVWPHFDSIGLGDLDPITVVSLCPLQTLFYWSFLENGLVMIGETYHGFYRMPSLQRVAAGK